MAKTLSADETDIKRHFDVLCNKIGNRLSGGDGEQRAADYIEDRFNRLGLANVTQQPFEFPNCESLLGKLRVGRGGRLQAIANAQTSGFSRSTPPGGVKGEIAYIQTGSEVDFQAPLRGKVGLLIGSLSLADSALKARLLNSGLVGLIVVDARIPFEWPVPTGGAAQWMEDYTLPTMGIPYFDAHKLVRKLPMQAHMTIKARIFPDTSQNVIGEIVGSRRPQDVIVISGHHDCVPGNVGANDNGSGVVFTLELARMFSRKRPRRTIRFVSYGVEEKLSVGSYVYMRSLSPIQRKQVVLAINADGCGGVIGMDEVTVTGSSRLLNLASEHWRRRRHPAEVTRGVFPWSDHYPFNIVGAPSLCLGRSSIMGGGLWELHSVHDNLDNISIPVMARTIETTAALLDRVASSERLPFARKIDQDLMKEVRACAKNLYRHPWRPEDHPYPD